MASAPVKRLKQLGDQLSASNLDAPTLEKLPNIPQIAGDSTGQYAKGPAPYLAFQNDEEPDASRGRLPSSPVPTHQLESAEPVLTNLLTMAPARFTFAT